MRKTIACIACALLPLLAWSKQPTWVLVGDGTLAEQTAEQTDARGWGQALPAYLVPTVTVKNLAQEGLSIKGVVDEIGVEKLLADTRRGDVLLVQFGQNDRHEQSAAQYSSVDMFIRRLATLTDAALKAKLQVILVTPLAEPYFKNGVLIDRLGAYPDAVRNLARQKNIPLLDLELRSRQWLQSVGEEGVAAYYVDVDTSESPASDYLLNEEGAAAVGKMAAEELKALKKMAKYVVAEP